VSVQAWTSKRVALLSGDEVPAQHAHLAGGHDGCDLEPASVLDPLVEREADAWCHTYNHRRRNHGDYMNGRRPIDLLELAS
jgi:hypothetical protein